MKPFFLVLILLKTQISDPNFLQVVKSQKKIVENNSAEIIVEKLNTVSYAWKYISVDEEPLLWKGKLS